MNPNPFASEIAASTHPGSLPMVSVIVPVRNEQKHLAPTLLQILQQNYPAERFEVLVADGRSTDATREIVANLQLTYSNLLLFDNPGQWSSSGRNVAIQNSRGSILVLIDGHCEIENPNYLALIVDAFRRSEADCIGRPQPLDIRDANPFQVAIAMVRSGRLGHHPSSFIYEDRESWVPPMSVAVAYRRRVFDRVGMFDESFDACEDVELNQRLAQAGMRCFFTPRAAVRYTPRESLKGLWFQLYRYGRGRGRLLRKHPETFGWAGFAPALFVLGLVAGPVLGWMSSPLMTLFLGVISLYLLIILTLALTLAWKAGRIGWLFLIPVIAATIHLAAGIGILREIFLGPSSPPRQKQHTLKWGSR